MANKEKDVELDEFNFDDDLNLDFDTEPQAPALPEGRDAIMSLPGIAAGSAAKAILGPGKRKSLILNALPDEYKTAYDAYDKLASQGVGIYREAKDQLRNTKRELKTATRQVLPIIRSYMPKKLAKKLEEMSKDDSPSFGSYDPKEAQIDSAMSAMDLERVNRAAQERMAEQEVEKQAGVGREVKLNSYVTEILNNVRQLTSYQNTIGTDYRKKMLELQYRQYFALTDMLELQRNSSEKIIPAVEAIVKNTALPDYAKEEFGEITSALMKRRVAEAMSPARFLQGYIERNGENIKGKIREFLGGVNSAIAEVGAGASMASMMMEGDGSGAELSPAQQRSKSMQSAASLAGSALAGKFITPQVKKLQAHIKQQLEKNPKFKNMGMEASYVLSNIPRFMNTYGSDMMYDGQYGKPFRWLTDKMGWAFDQYSGDDARLADQVADSERAKSWNERNNLTLNEIIPSALERIDQSIRRLTDPSAELYEYDIDKRRLVSVRELNQRIRAKADDAQTKEWMDRRLDTLVEKIDPEKKLSADARVRLKKLLDEKSRNIKLFNVSDLANNYEAYDSQASGDNQELMDFFDDISSDERLRNQMNINVSNDLNSITSGIMGKQSTIDELVKQYGQAALVRAGVFVEEGGRLIANRKMFDTYGRLDDTDGLAERAGGGSLGPLGGGKGGKGGTSWGDAQFGRLQTIVTDGVALGIRKAMFDGKEYSTLQSVLESIKTTKKPSDSRNMDGVAAALHEIRDQLKANAVNEPVNSIRDMIQQIIEHGLSTTGGGSFSLNFPGKQKVMDFGKRVGGWLGNQRDRAKRYMSNAWDYLSSKKDFAKDAIVGAYNGVIGGASEFFKAMGGWRDIIDAEGNVFLRADWLKADKYRTKDGSPIRRIRDIAGGIYDEEGNVLFSPEDVREKLAGLRYNTYTGFKKLVAGVGGFFGDAFRNAGEKLGTGFHRIKSGLKSVYHTVATSADIYVEGQMDEPRLRNQLMIKGFYVSQETGEPIRSVFDIDGPVITKYKEVVISSAELADPNFKLVDVNGKPFKTTWQKVSSKASGLWGRMKGLAAAPFGSVMNAFGAAKDAATAGLMWLKQFLPKGGGFGLFSGNKIVNRLDKIYKLLKARMPGEGGDEDEDIETDENGKSIRVRSLKQLYRIVRHGRKKVGESERLAKVKAAIGSLIDTGKGFVLNVTPTGVKGKAKEMLSGLSGWLGDKKSATADWIGGKLSDLNGWAKKKVAGDVDGDGDRDGSWQDIFQNRKAKAKQVIGEQYQKVKDKLAEKAGEAKGFLSGIWDKLSGLGTLIGGKFMSVVTKGVGPLMALLKTKVWEAGKGLLKQGGKAAWGLARAGVGMAADAAMWVGRNVLWRGAQVAATAVVGTITLPEALIVGAVAGATYLVYRGITGPDSSKLDELRFAQYGTEDYDDSDSDDVCKLRYLEALMLKYTAYNGDGIATIKGVPDSEMKEALKQFGISMEDEDDYKLWSEWFFGRFAPVYLLWASRARQNMPTVAFADIGNPKKASPRDMKKILKGVVLPKDHPIYRVEEGPFDDEDLNTADDVADVQEDVIDDIDELIEDMPEEKTKAVKARNDDFIKQNQGYASYVNAANYQAPQSGKITVANTTGANARVGPNDLDQVKTTLSPDVSLPKGRHVDKMINAVDSIRLKTYGLDSLTLDRVEKIYALEELVFKNVVRENGVMVFKGNLDEVVKQGTTLFGVATDIPVAMQNWRTWFESRFIPTLLNYLTLVDRYMPNANPFALIISSSSPMLYDIAVATRSTQTLWNGNKVPVWQVPNTPWPDRTPLNMELSSTEGNLEYLLRLKKEYELRQQEAQKEDPDKPKTKPQNIKVVPAKKRENGSNYSNSSLQRLFGSDGKFTGGQPGDSGPVGSFGGVDFSQGAYGQLGDRGSGSYAQIDRGDGKSKAAIINIIKQAAALTGVDPNLMLSMAYMESSLDPSARAGTSRATGLYQFLVGGKYDTWGEMLSKYGNDYGIPPNASAMDPVANAILGGEFIRQNMKAAQKVLNRPITAADIYTMHMMGSGAGPKFLANLERDPNAIAQKDFPNQAASNTGVFAKDGRWRTYGEIYDSFQKRIVSGNSQVSLMANKAGVEMPSKASPATAPTAPAANDASAGGKVPAALAKPSGAPSYTSSETANITNMKAANDAKMGVTAANIVNNAPIPTTATATKDPATVNAVMAKAKQSSAASADAVAAPARVKEVAQATATEKQVKVIREEAKTSNDISYGLGTVAERQLSVLNQQLEVMTNVLTEIKGLRTDMGGMSGRQAATATAAPKSPAASGNPEITHGAGIISVGRKRA